MSRDFSKIKAVGCIWRSDLDGYILSPLRHPELMTKNRDERWCQDIDRAGVFSNMSLELTKTQWQEYFHKSHKVKKPESLKTAEA